MATLTLYFVIFLIFAYEEDNSDSTVDDYYCIGGCCNLAV